MQQQYKLVNIHENCAFPGIVYGELVEVGTGETYMAATLIDVFIAIKLRNLVVVNVRLDRFENCCVID